MSDREGLLQAIIEDPDDDIPRRVFADWLDDHEAPLHARFVRAQLDLAAFTMPGPEPWDDPASLEMAGINGALRGVLLEPFLPLVPHLGDPDGPPDEPLLSAFAFHARRGFIESLEVYGGTTAALFVMQFPQVMAQTPLQHLRFVNQPTRPGLEDGYTGTAPLQMRTLRALLAQEDVRRLRTLDLRNQRGAPQAAEALMQNATKLEGLSALLLDAQGVPEPLQTRLRERFGERLRLRSWPPPNEDDIPF